MPPDLKKLIDFSERDGFRIHFPYDAALVAAVRELPVRQFHKDGTQSYWSAAFDIRNVHALAEFAIRHEFAVDEAAGGKLRELARMKPAEEARKRAAPTIHAEYLAGEVTQVRITPPDWNLEVTGAVREDGQARWHKETKSWVLPFSRNTVALVDRLAREHGFVLEDGLAGILNAQMRRSDEIMSLSGAQDANIDIPVRAGLAYLGYQKAGIAYGARKGSVLIGDEMGLGKTIQAIGLSNMSPDIRSVLVIAPASLKINWKREWEKWDVKRLSCGIVADGKPDSWPEEAQVVIVNFDLVGKHLARLHERTWDLLIVDEAHNLCNPKTKRTRLILGHKAKRKEEGVDPIPAQRRVLMTGTPIENRPLDLWPLIHAVAPERFNDFFAYARRYCDAHKNEYGWDFTGASHLDELQAELRAHCMVRRKKSEVLTELPPKIRQIIRLDAPDLRNRERKAMGADLDRLAQIESRKVLAYLSDNRKDYEEAARELGSLRNLDFKEVARIRHDTALAKAPQVVEIVKEALEQGKVILFAHHKDVLRAFEEAFGDAAVTVDGDTPNAARQQAVDRFQNDPSCTVFLGSIRAAGAGITLTASSHVIFAELDWVPGIMAQAEDRPHRIGQRDTVLVWHVVVEGTIDARMTEILVSKQSVIDSALDAPLVSQPVRIADLPPPVQEEPPVEVLLPDFRTVPHDEVARWLAQSPETRRKAQREADQREERAGRATRRARSGGLEAQAAAMTAEQIAAVHEGLRRLASVCDGAVAQDAMGFNAADAWIGSALAGLPEINPLQAAYAREMLHKYITQLGEAAVARMSHPEEAEESASPH